MRPAFFISLPDGQDVGFQVLHEGVVVAGQNVDQHDAFDVTFVIGDLRGERSHGKQGETHHG
jgi:hypothetical protein